MHTRDGWTRIKAVQTATFWHLCHSAHKGTCTCNAFKYSALDYMGVNVKNSRHKRWHTVTVHKARQQTDLLHLAKWTCPYSSLSPNEQNIASELKPSLVARTLLPFKCFHATHIALSPHGVSTVLRTSKRRQRCLPWHKVIDVSEERITCISRIEG
jgi:hypothetical protein